MLRANPVPQMMALSLCLATPLCAQQVATGRVQHEFAPTPVVQAAEIKAEAPAQWMRNRDAEAVAKPAARPLAHKPAPKIAPKPPAPTLVLSPSHMAPEASGAPPLVATTAPEASPPVVATAEPRKLKNLPDVAFAPQTLPYATLQPRAVKKVPVSLPDNQLQQLREPAEVLVQLKIAANGQVQEAKILNSPNAAWQDEVLKTARQWEYEPLPHPATAEVVFRIMPPAQ